MFSQTKTNKEKKFTILRSIDKVNVIAITRAKLKLTCIIFQNCNKIRSVITANVKTFTETFIQQKDCPLHIFSLLNCLKNDKFTVSGSHRRFSIKKGVLRNFANFTGKHLWQTSKNTFFTEHLLETASVQYQSAN